MTPLPFLAHGALGPYDELIFLGISVIFLVMMGISWFTSRGAVDDDQATAISETNLPPADTDEHEPEHFRLN